MSRIVSMEGFDKLTESQKLEVLNNPHNFFGLSETANKSKGAKTYMQWKKYKAGNIDVDSNFRHSMIIEEAVLERVIQGQIDNFLTGGIN